MALITMLPPELQRQVDNEINSDETILWAAQPSPGRMARQGIAPFLMGIPFTAFAVFWVAMAGGMAWFGHGVASGISGRSAAPGPFILFPLFGIPFILAGLGLLTSPFWLMLKANRTAYALTNQRALILEGNFFGSVTVRSFGPEMLGDRTRIQSGDGSGDLIFTRATTVSLQSGYTSYNPNTNFSAYNRGRSVINQVGFYGVPDVKGVDDLIRATFEEKRSNRP